MTQITMTVELANACGQDKANRAMRKAGRTAWSIEDYNIAAIEAARIAVSAGLAPPEHLARMLEK